MDVSVNTVFKVGLAAGAAYIAYLLYQSLKAPAAAVDAAYQGTTQAAADAIVSLTHTAVIPQGSVALPNGSIVPVSSLQNKGFQPDGTLQMSDGVSTYVISSGAVPGTYTATGLGYLRKRGLR